MAASSDQVAWEIDRERAELDDNLHRLGGTLTRSVAGPFQRAGAWVEEHPVDALVMALGTGFFLASLVGRSEQEREPEARRMNETLSLTGTALSSLATKQFKQMRAEVTNGVKS